MPGNEPKKLSVFVIIEPANGIIIIDISVSVKICKLFLFVNPTILDQTA